MEIVILILFGATACVHVLDFFRKAWIIKNFRLTANTASPRISVLVCAHNEASHLRELLPLLTQQEYSSLEVIIVLDRCDDESEAVVKPYLSDHIRLLRIDQVSPPIHPKKYAITQAIAQASGEWMLLTDADCRPRKDWIKEMVRGMAADKDLVLGISPHSTSAGFLNTLIQYETFITALQFVSKTLSGKAYMGLGRNIGYRKTAFVRVDGFGETAHLTGGDDDLLVQRMATSTNVGVVLSAASHVSTLPQTTWQSFFHQKTRHFGVGRHYTVETKRNEIVRWTLHLLFWGFFFVHLATDWLWALLILMLAFTIKAISINIVADRLAKRFNHLWLPIVDLAYVVIFPLLSLRSVFVKRITWKK